MLSTSGSQGLASSSGPAGTGTPQQFLRFALGQAYYGISITRVREILQRASMTRLPMLPPVVHGVMNLRGAVVPVIDLADRLGLGTSHLHDRSCVIVVEVEPEEGQVLVQGILVDAVHEVFDVQASELEAVPSIGTRIPPEYIEHMTRVRQQVIEVLSLDRVLDQDDLALRIGRHTQDVSDRSPHGPRHHN